MPKEELPEETDFFFNLAEKYWIQPCFAQAPPWLHGMCMYLPAFMGVAILLSIVAIMAWCEQRSKKAETPAVTEKKTSKKAKKTD